VFVLESGPCRPEQAEPQDQVPLERVSPRKARGKEVAQNDLEERKTGNAENQEYRSPLFEFMQRSQNSSAEYSKERPSLGVVRGCPVFGEPSLHLFENILGE